MNNNPNRNKWMTILVLVLVMLNIATVTAFWVMQKKRMPPPSPGGAMEFMVKELKFDSMQREQLQQLVEQHRHDVMEIRGKNREIKDSFFALLKQPGINDSVLAVAAAKANAPDQQLEIITFRHFQKVRALCNETQKKKFDQIIQQVLRMNAPAGPPPGGRKNRHPGDGPPPPADRSGPPPGEAHEPPPDK